MNYMFKNVTSIFSVEMNSDKGAKILSMISTFESCNSLESFSINGFNSKYLTSMRKVFYNSALSNIILK
jgi:hypothetical protein